MIRVESKKTFLKFAGLALVLIVMSCGVSRTDGQGRPSRPPGPSGQKQEPFDDRAATRLLAYFTQGLEDGNQKQVLASFNFGHMQEGERYEQQLISFLGHAESIRVHVNLVSTAPNGDDKPVIEADFEMEITPRDGTLPVRKQTRVHFSVESTSGGWKFVDVQPRGFFSTDPGQ